MLRTYVIAVLHRTNVDQSGSPYSEVVYYNTDI